MGGLKQWARDVIAIVLLGGLLELAVPDGQLQRYARLVVGLLIMLSVLNPVLDLLQRPERLVSDAEAALASPPALGGASLQERVDRIRARAEQETERLAVGGLEARAVRVALQVPGVRDARAKATLKREGDRAAVGSVELYVSAAPSARAKAEAELRSGVARELGAAPEAVHIRWESNR